MPMDTTDNNQQVSLRSIAHQQPMFLAPPSQHQIMQRNQHPIALPPIAHQQSTFVQPPAIRGPRQQHALPQSQHVHTQQQLALPPITYQQQLALPQPQQQYAVPAPYQQLALPQPQQQLAIDYDPRGVKRQNAEVRVGDRKKILLEDERTDAVKRKSENKGRQEKKKLVLGCGKRDQLIWE